MSTAFGVLAALCVCVSSCAPKIRAFSATPSRLCVGDSTTLVWKASGHVSLASRPPVEDSGLVPSSGSRRFAPPSTTRFELSASRRARTVFARQDVVLLPDSAEQPLVFATEPLGRDSVLAADSLRDAQWAGTLRVRDVSSRSGRGVRVLHAGRAAVLPADGSPSLEFQGVPLSGPWVLRAALLAGEVMDGATAPPDRLRVLVRLSCRA